MGEIQADLHLAQFLGVGVVGLIDHGRLVPDAVETRRTAAVEDQTVIHGPALLPQAPDLILGVDVALDTLFNARVDRPLRVLRRIGVHARVHAVTKIRIVEHIGCDDAADLVIVVGFDPNGQDSQCGATVWVRPDQRHRNERNRRWIEPSRQTARRDVGLGTARVGRRNGVRQRIQPSQCNDHARGDRTDENMQHARNQPAILSLHWTHLDSSNRGATLAVARYGSMSDLFAPATPRPTSSVARNAPAPCADHAAAETLRCSNQCPEPHTPAVRIPRFPCPRGKYSR